MEMVRRIIVACALMILAGALHAARAEERQPIRIAIMSRTVFYLPVWLAEWRGYFHDEGLDATVEVFDNAEYINDALRDDPVQIAMRTPESIMVDALHGGSLRIVAGNAGRLPHFTIAQPGINSVAELKGKTIGVLSDQEGTAHLVPQMAAAAGLQPFPLSYEAEAAGFSNLGPLTGIIPDWQFTSVNVDEHWAEAHRATLVSALRALRRGLDDVAADPAGAASVAAEGLQTTRPLAERALVDTARMGILTPGMEVSMLGLVRVHTALVAAKLLPDEPFSPGRVTDLRHLRGSRDIVLRGEGSLMLGQQF